MIKQQDKKKVAVLVNLNDGTKNNGSLGFADITYDPELDKFSGDGFVPEKHKIEEKRLANSILPPFK